MQAFCLEIAQPLLDLILTMPTQYKIRDIPFSVTKI